MPNSRFALHGLAPPSFTVCAPSLPPIHGLCTFFTLLLTPLSTAPSPPHSQFTVCTSRFARCRISVVHDGHRNRNSSIICDFGLLSPDPPFAIFPFAFFWGVFPFFFKGFGGSVQIKILAFCRDFLAVPPPPAPKKSKERGIGEVQMNYFTFWGGWILRGRFRLLSMWLSPHSCLQSSRSMLLGSCQ